MEQKTNIEQHLLARQQSYGIIEFFFFTYLVVKLLKHLSERISFYNYKDEVSDQYNCQLSNGKSIVPVHPTQAIKSCPGQ